MIRRTFAGLLALASLVLCMAHAQAQSVTLVDRINSGIRGTLVDYTQNNGCDRRIYSSALCECRDLYVYLPPGYDRSGHYPLLIWLHSYTDDECEFAKHVVPILDAAIVAGQLPPMVVAAPDGSLTGAHHYFALGSWYVNSPRGRFADYIASDVYEFMLRNFGVSPDRADHAIAGFSMGGFGAYSIGLKHPGQFKIVGGIGPALNLRHSGPGDDYTADFVPGVSYLRQEYSPREVIGEFYGGFMKVRAYMIISPVFGGRSEAIARVSNDNPIELLDRLNVQPGVQEYYAGYTTTDELNIDAQVESFVYAAANRGIHVESKRYTCGDHSIPFMQSALPDFFAWLKAHLGAAPASESAEPTVYSPLIASLLPPALQPSATSHDAVLILPAE
jgi:S-formylglutathione hydrolase FrmB